MKTKIEWNSKTNARAKGQIASNRTQHQLLWTHIELLCLRDYDSVVLLDSNEYQMNQFINVFDAVVSCKIIIKSSVLISMKARRNLALSQQIRICQHLYCRYDLSFRFAQRQAFGQSCVFILLFERKSVERNNWVSEAKAKQVSGIYLIESYLFDGVKGS